VTALAQTVFDQQHYLELIQARSETIRLLLPQLKEALNLSSALDVGCGLGFFSQLLRECGLGVRGFDGRPENIDEAQRRYPEISFEVGDVQSASIPKIGVFDFVLCFGLLYHLENSMSAVRNLRALTRHVLMLESMCLPQSEPWMLLRNEPSDGDQSLTDVAFYPSEGCIVKMLYRGGFSAVYRLKILPDHDEFRETSRFVRRRTVLLACDAPIDLPGLKLLPEPQEAAYPWAKRSAGAKSLTQRVRHFLTKSRGDKYASVAMRLVSHFPRILVPFRTSFGAWLLLGGSALDQELLRGRFESNEMRFVSRYLQPGMTVMDVGAHHGLYTLLTSKCVGVQGRVIAFEPSPRECKQLRRNVRLNLTSNVRIVPYAVGRERGLADLYVVEGAEDGCNSLRPPAVTSRTHSVRVEVVSLDEFVRDEKIGRLDFIKLDAEGAELDVLRGTERLLQSVERPTFLVEVYDIRTLPWGYKAYEIVKFLASVGYSWFWVGGEGGLEPVAPDLRVFDANLVAIPDEKRSSEGNL
jgi:FkbM family methyltransferase